MSLHRAWPIVVLLACLPLGAARAIEPAPKPKPVETPSSEQLEGSIHRGVQFLSPAE